MARDESAEVRKAPPIQHIEPFVPYVVLRHFIECVKVNHVVQLPVLKIVHDIATCGRIITKCSFVTVSSARRNSKLLNKFGLAVRSLLFARNEL